MPQRRQREETAQETPIPVAPTAPTIMNAPEMAPPNPRPARQHRAPLRYRDNAQDSDTEENFDINAGSQSDSSDDAEDASPAVQDRGSRPPSATTTAVNTALTDSLATGQSGQDQPSARPTKSTAHDVAHFFRKEIDPKTRKVTTRICLPCE